MGEFVVSIGVDILPPVVINGGEQSSISRIAAASGDFAGVGNTAEFVVLDPKISFEDFRGGNEAQQGRVAAREASAFFVREPGRAGDEAGARSRSARGYSVFEERAAVGVRVSRSCGHSESPSSSTRALHGF